MLGEHSITPLYEEGLFSARTPEFTVEDFDASYSAYNIVSG